MSPTTSPSEPRTPRLYHAFRPLGAVLLMLAAVATLLVVAAVAHGAGAPPPIALALGQLGMLACALVVARAARQPRQALGIAAAPARFVGAAALIGLSMWYWNLLLTSLLVPYQPEDVEALERLVRGPPVALVLVTAALAPAVCEEVIFRGAVLRGLASRLPAWAAIVVTSALFAAYHMNIVQALPTFLLGAALAVVTLRAGSILPAVIGHFLNNAMAIALSRIDGAAAALASPIALAVFAALFVAGIAVALRAESA